LNRLPISFSIHFYTPFEYSFSLNENPFSDLVIEVLSISETSESQKLFCKFSRLAADKNGNTQTNTVDGIIELMKSDGEWKVTRSNNLDRFLKSL
jgi:ribosomal protein L11